MFSLKERKIQNIKNVSLDNNYCRANFRKIYKINFML